MAWNPKALKTLGPRTQPLDRFDREAEREGSAIRTNRQFAPSILGKRIAKNSRKAEGFAKTAEFIATRNLVKDTAARAAELVRPDHRYRLTQAA